MIILLAGVLPLVAVRLPVLRRALPVPGWVGAVGCCMHALVDGMLRVLSVLGAHPTQLPASAWTSFDRHASVTRPKRRAWLVSAVAGCLALTVPQQRREPIMITEAAPRTTAGHPLRQGLTPLVVDVAVPIGLYYLLAKGFGMSEPAALAWSSAVPAVRTVWGVVAQRRVNAPAALMLAVNVAGVLLSLLSGDPRLMLAK
ncbi:hypothetical protein LWP59_23705 [Amycolatopsis acidiphila]|nr:hypothetical protein LWP59_23705 [Amycolatopsis acidiphila]GHG52994.1 hypothetical protein GCM10017788_01390 [Amycolatopsis acidiphila]